EEESSIASKYLYQAARENYMTVLKAAPRRKRLQQLHLLDDVKYCLTPDQATVIPVLQGDRLVLLGH
ncbi:MAG TPA: 2-phosphosulfolactate phosphatase, partial [Flavobacteriales bacterium]|nr:2-phosphosulfolactate phosphatase [Flavobacteriales bacterium]